MGVMTKFTALGLVALAVLASQRSESAGPPATRVGVINIEETLSSTPAGKRANEAFDQNRKAKQGALDNQQADLRQADAELVKNKGSMDKASFETKRAELEKKYVALQELYAKLERELAQDRNKLIQDLMHQADAKIAAIARSEGVQVILDQSATVWVDPALDLTAKLGAQMQ